MANCNANSSRFELLSRENYDTWRIQAEAIFIKSKTWPIVSGTKSKPAPAELKTDNSNATLVAAGQKAIEE